MICSRCDLDKPETAFHSYRSGLRTKFCRRCKDGKSPLPYEASTLKEVDRKVPITNRFTRTLEAKRYIITSAQNATAVHAGFWATLRVAATHLGAELVVIPLRYKNPTSLWSKNQETDEWWDDRVTPFLFNQRKKLGPNIVLAADVKTQPTAVSPLTGFEGLTGPESCIIGHPTMQMRTVPVPSGLGFPKLLSTTGSCTKHNYSPTKAGAIGKFHHFLGAVVVELKGKLFHLRQINADRHDGSFTDLDKHYTPGAVFDAPPALGLVLGDTHVELTSPQVDKATFGKGGIVDTLSPETLVWHDVFDGYSVNPHHVGNPWAGLAKAKYGGANVALEIEKTIRFMAERTNGRRSVVVASNHNDFLARWVRNNSWQSVGINAEFYIDTVKVLIESLKRGPGGYEVADPFAYWVHRLRADSDIRALAIDESFMLADNECGSHGHFGPNGAPGSIKNLSLLGTKMITGHGHAPGIEHGHYRVGTSTPLRLEYTHGPSSQLNSHCVVYATGARTLINIIGTEWHLE